MGLIQHFAMHIFNDDDFQNQMGYNVDTSSAAESQRRLTTPTPLILKLATLTPLTTPGPTLVHVIIAYIFHSAYAYAYN